MSYRHGKKQGLFLSQCLVAQLTSLVHPYRPFILGLVRQEIERATTPQAIDKGTARKRKRSPEHNSSSFDAVGNVAGPSSNSISPRRPAAAAVKSPSRPKKPKPTADEIIDMTVPSSDIEEDEIPTSLNLAPKGMFQALLEYTVPLNESTQPSRRICGLPNMPEKGSIWFT